MGSFRKKKKNKKIHLRIVRTRLATSPCTPHRMTDTHNASHARPNSNPFEVISATSLECGGGGECSIALAGFEEAHGLKACMVAPTRIIAGLGLSLDIHRLDAPGATGEACSLYIKHFLDRNGNVKPSPYYIRFPLIWR